MGMVVGQQVESKVEQSRIVVVEVAVLVVVEGQHVPQLGSRGPQGSR